MYISSNIKEAKEYCKYGKKKKRIFGEEVNETGGRQFLTTTNQNFKEFYLTLKKGSMAFYEIVNNEMPCKGYWDVDCWLDEPIRKEDKIKIEEELVKSMTEEIIKIIQKKTGKEMKQEDFMVLRSEKESKISMHLVLNGGIWFNNNKEVQQITEEAFYEEDIPKEKYAVYRDGKRTGIVDRGVYNKNQNFRMLWSTKYGKKGMLEVSPVDKHTISMENEMEILEASMLQDTRVEEGNVEGIPQKKIKISKEVGQEEEWKENRDPEIREFIHTNFGIREGKWRRMAKDTMVLSTAESKICEVIGRKHKRNNVYIVANTQTYRFYKKCHKCKNSILKEAKLPVELIPKFKAQEMETGN